MFGHNDNQGDDQNNQKDDTNDTIGVMPPVVPDPSVTAGLTGSSPLTPGSSSDDAPSAPSVPSSPSVVEPTTDTETTDTPEDTSSDDSAGTSDAPGISPASSDDNSSADTNDETSEAAAPADSELMSLKQQALQQLSPLVGHLDQTPEEKFRTTMMMIQASDDSTLVKAAFEAAQAISDDKTRAQALLDVINEINYFTQHKTE